MNVTIWPSTAKGVVTAPPSKSVAHRALICGALTEGSTICNVAYSQDIEATLRCLEAMGAWVKREDHCVKIGGLDPFKIPENVVLDCGESGSTLRFLLPICLLSSSPVTLKGSQRLLERPLAVYEEICRRQKLTFSRKNDGVTICGPLSADRFQIKGNISSQFISGLLFALSLVEGNSSLEILPPFESVSYVHLTLATQKQFGIKVLDEEAHYCIEGNQRYSPQTYTVEGDCSNAAFLEAYNLLGGDVKVSGLSAETAQGDWVYKSFYKVLQDENRVFDLSDCPDLGPVMFALAAALGGARFVGTARLRIKESDRVASMVRELEKFGVTALVEEDTVEIQAESLKPPSVPLSGHNDHRIVMALSLLCSVVGGVIEGAEAVAKSYPDYFDAVQALGIQFEKTK